MCVLDPLKVVIDNYPDNKEEVFSASNHPKDPEQGKRSIPFSNVIYIEFDRSMIVDVPHEHPKQMVLHIF